MSHLVSKTALIAAIWMLLGACVSADDSLSASHANGDVAESKSTEGSATGDVPAEGITVNIGNREQVSLTLMANTIRIIEADEKFRHVSVSAHATVTVQPLESGEVAVLATSPGTMTLKWNTESGRERKVEITVVGDTRPLQAHLRVLYPELDVETIPISRSVLLRGAVLSQRQASEVVEIARFFFPHVLNQLRIKYASGQIPEPHANLERTPWPAHNRTIATKLVLSAEQTTVALRQSESITLVARANVTHVLGGGGYFRFREGRDDLKLVGVEKTGGREVRIHARSAGVKSLVLIDETGRRYAVEVEVLGSADRLQAQLQQLYPDLDIQQLPIGGSAVALRGGLPDDRQLGEILDIAKMFYPSVINQLHVRPSAGQNASQSFPLVVLEVEFFQVDHNKLREAKIDLAKTLASYRTADGQPNSFDKPHLLQAVIPQGSVDLLSHLLRTSGAMGDAIMAPKVTVVPGKTAHLNDFIERPVSVVEEIIDGERHRRFVTQKKGTELDLTPEILDDGRLQLKVFAQVTRDIENGDLKGIQLRRLGGTAQLEAGESFVVAETVRYVDEEQVPQEKRLGLLLLVTPRIQHRSGEAVGRNVNEPAADPGPDVDHPRQPAKAPAPHRDSSLHEEISRLHEDVRAFEERRS